MQDTLKIEIQQEQQRDAISRSGNNNQIANSDDLDNYERNTEETIETTTLTQEGINECTAEQESPEIPINVPTEVEQFYVDIRNIAQPTFNLLICWKSQWGTEITETVIHLQRKFRTPDKERIAEPMITVDLEQCPVEFIWCTTVRFVQLHVPGKLKIHNWEQHQGIKIININGN